MLFKDLDKTNLAFVVWFQVRANSSLNPWSYCVYQRFWPFKSSYYFGVNFKYFSNVFFKKFVSCPKPMRHAKIGTVKPLNIELLFLLTVGRVVAQWSLCCKSSKLVIQPLCKEFSTPATRSFWISKLLSLKMLFLFWK